jgi:site-specific DNA-methyltransferase (adenine-specific)
VEVCGVDECRLILGDVLDLLRDMNTASVDAVVTDPPYFQPATHYCGTREEGRARRSIADMSILELFFRLFIGECARVLKPTGSFYLFCDGQSYPIAFTGLYPHVKYVRPLVWDKVVGFNGYTWRHQHELIAWGEREESPRLATGDGDVLRCPAVPVGERLHPAEKPVKLLRCLIAKTAEGGTVLDPFMGSGGTGVASLQTGRRFIGIELSADYYAIAQKRLAEVDGPLFAAAQPSLFAPAEEGAA